MTIEHMSVYVNDLEIAKEFFVIFFGSESNICYHNCKKELMTYSLKFEDSSRLKIMNKLKSKGLEKQII